MVRATDIGRETHARMSSASQRFLLAQARLNYLRQRWIATNTPDSSIREAEKEWAEACCSYRQVLAEYSQCIERTRRSGPC